MDTREFLARAVPWPAPDGGWINMHVGPKFNGVAVQNVDAFLREVEKVKGERDVYFCMSQQRDAKPNGTKMLAKRSQPDALLLSSVFADVDVGETKAAKGQGYATSTEAITALKVFLDAAKLPRPSAIVASGSGGFHIHWFSDKPLIKALWQTYADELQRLADAHGFLIDPVVTRDSSRVLRVPGTLNFKHDPPKPVTLVDLGKSYDLSVVFASTTVAAPTSSAPGRSGGIQLPARFKGRTEKIVVELTDAPLADPKTVVPLCPFLSKTLQTGGDGRSEPQWYQAIRCATYMENGRKLAHAFSKGDPRYSEGGTDAKWAYALDHKENLGWPSCSGIANSGAPECKTCPHRSKGLSPFKLQRELAPRERKELAKPAVEHWYQMLPHGFSFDKTRQTIMMEVMKDDDDDDDPDNDNKSYQTEVFQTRIISEPWADNIGLNLRLQLDEKKTFDALIPYVDFTRSRIYAKLFEQRIMRGNAMTPAKMEAFLASWVEKMNSYVLIRDQQPFGWREEEGNPLPIGFAYGGYLFKPGAKETCPVVDPKMKDEYSPCGTKEAWFEAANLILGQNKPELEIIIAASLAGPLMRFTGQPGALLTVYSTESGAHKSTASKVGAAIWGHPRKSRESVGSTQKGTIKRLVCTQNLTCQWDDMQDDSHCKIVSATAFQFCQGHEGTKLTQSRDFAETGDWQTLCVACLNKSFVDYISRKEPAGAPKLNRVFEIRHDKIMREGVIDKLKAMQIEGNLDRNFGQIGLQYAELLANNVEEIQRLVDNENAEFTKAIASVGMKDFSEARFWVCVCVTILAAAKLANEIGIKLNYDTIKNRLARAFAENVGRKKEEALEAGTVNNVHNTLSLWFTHAGNGHMVWTMGSTKHGGTEHVDLLNGEDRIQECFVHLITDKRLIRINRPAFRDWCADNNMDYGATVRGCKEHFGADSTHKYKLAGGTKYVRMQEWCMEIPVPEGSPFEDMLFAHGGRAKEQII